jgi:hypothetical protein
MPAKKAIESLGWSADRVNRDPTAIGQPSLPTGPRMALMHPPISRTTALGILIAAAGPVLADPTEPPPPPPLPTEASGVATPEATPVGDDLLAVPRAALFLPRWAVWAAAQPVRLGAWAYERYHLGALYHRGLLNIDDSFGVVPTASLGGGYGVDLGVRAFDRDLFGAREQLRLSAAFGGQYDQAYGVALRSGDRFGRIAIGVAARYERRPRDRFAGIGNEDLAPAPSPDAPPAMPIDPAMDATAIDTRFRQDVARVAANVDVAIAGPLSARGTGAYLHRRFDTVDGDARSIERSYDTGRLAGFADGSETVYVEAELRYDSRRPASLYETKAIDATGWLASIHAGVATGVDGDPTDYQRYGAEVQRHIDLYRGSRVLSLRAMVDTVAGTDGRTDGKIAFTDLPRLGGLDDLRGYPADRFRDKAVALASAEYSWSLGNYFAAFGFVDAGRTARSVSELSTGDLHAGYGGGLQMHTRLSFLGRLQIAATPDGDWAFQLALSPAFGRRERAGRY